ncbi:hypothetical protein RQP46_004437 [Phenoliferia psychrophenolica]
MEGKTRSRSSSAPVPDSDDERAPGDQQLDLTLDADEHRPPKRARLDADNPPVAVPPPPAEDSGAEPPHASQELRSLLDGLDAAELDLLPSSDPAPPALALAPADDNTPQFARVLRRITSVESKRVVHSPGVRGDSEADNSGVFLVTDSGPVRVLEDDPDLIGGDEVLLDTADEEIVLEAAETLLSDPAEFEGDDIWDGYEDNTTIEPGFTQPVARREEPPSSDPDLELEKLHGGRWDAFRKPADPNAPLTFFSGGGKAVSLSEDALQRARALLEADDETPLPPLAFPSATAFNAPRPSTTVAPRSTPSGDPPRSSSFDRAQLFDTLNPHRTSSPPHLPPNVVPSFGGFTSGSGAPVAGPSAAAVERIKSRLDGPLPTFGGFTSGSGAPVAAPSAATVASVTSRLGAPQPTFGGFTSGSGAPVAGPSAASVARAIAHLDSPGTRPDGGAPRGSNHSRDRDVFADSPAGAKGKGRASFELTSGLHASSEADTMMPHAESPSASRVLPLRGPSSPAASQGGELPVASPRPTANPRALPKTTATPSKATFGTPRPKPFRVGAPLPFHSPMLSHKKPPTASTSAVPHPGASSATPVKAAPGLRRLNLAMTPRPRVTHVHKFVTPFKGGVRPPGLAPTGLPPSAIKAVPESAQTKDKGKAREEPMPTGSLVSVFNLTPQGPRQGLAASGFRPQTHFYEHLLSEGLPEEAIAMDSVSAASYVFECGRGEVEAMAALASDGASLVTLPWVRNHWSLIVWKLASLVRTRPDVRATYWHWQAAVDQLKYRYEREVNQAQRSPIKRIQEQDSSAGHPMVLCVSQIRWGEASETADAPLVIVGLELTDGWYRIRSNVDPTLRSACERGKIVVGCKLAISGAKIESSRDGTDVLDALTRSSLTIFGNSTSLAPWHVKLGWVGHPFIAALGTLTSAGGVAPLLDVIIERAFPCGYIDMGRNSQHDTWNAEEELVRADAWATGRAAAEAKLADAVEKTKGDWDDILELLQEASHRVGLPTGPPDADSTEEEPDEILDRLESAPNKSAIVNKLSAQQVASTLQLAAENSVRDKGQAVSDIELELATSFPPRNVRVFRVLRIRDAQNGEISSDRTALLTVWDADGFAPDFFNEDQRYLVSNVIPKGNWLRKASEILLATRRDSKWERVE